MGSSLRRLEVRNFRNYESLTVDFDPSTNVLCGPNGAGKTNLLEAIYYLALARSPRPARDGDLVRQGAPSFLLRADVGETRLEVRYQAERGRTALVNGHACQPLSELFGHLPTIFFSPDDLWLVKGGPGTRRRMLDELLLQARPAYTAALARFEEALTQRNALLREIRARRTGPALLAIWDEPLIEYGVSVATRRAAAVQVIGRAAAEAYAQLAPEETFSCRYACGIGEDVSPDGFRAALEAARAAELERGYTLVGPHRDDVVLELDGQPLRTYGSQGQQRSVVLALRLGERQALRRASGSEPLLLLDDVLSELDAARRRSLAAMLSGGGQVFLTATDSEVIPEAMRGRSYRVESGRLAPAAAA